MLWLVQNKHAIAVTRKRIQNTLMVHFTGNALVYLAALRRARHSDLLQAGRSGDRIPVEARFFAPVQTGPAAHPASYTMGTGSFPRVKRPGRGNDHPSHLVPRLKKEYS